MASSKERKIIQCLRGIVQKAARNGEEVSLRIVRTRAEFELGLEDGYLKSEEWKEKSKAVISEAFESAEEQDTAKPSLTAKGPSGVEASGKKTAQHSKSSGPDKSAETSVTARAKSKPGPAEVPEPIPTTNGNKSEDSDSSSEDSGDSSDGDESSDDTGSVGAAQTPAQTISTEPNGAHSQVNGVKRKHDESDSSDESSKEDSQEDSEEGRTDGPEQKKARTTSQIDSLEPGGVISNQYQSLPASAAIPAKPFEPPSGYVPATPSPLPTFSAANLAGKQIWHITAPAHLPLSMLTELALNDASVPVIHHENASYVIREDTAVTTATLLLPTSDGYERAQHPVARTLHLQREVRLPDLTNRQASQVTGSKAAAEVGQTAVSQVRPQPKGLRMRYRPSGFGTGGVGKIGSESDSESDTVREDGKDKQVANKRGDARPSDSSQMHSAVSNTTRSKPAEPQLPSKKEKKRDKAKRKEADGAPASGNDPSPSTFAPGQAINPDFQDTTTIHNGEKKNTEGVDESRRRKEEKRARKEGKKARAEEKRARKDGGGA